MAAAGMWIHTQSPDPYANGFMSRFSRSTSTQDMAPWRTAFGSPASTSDDDSQNSAQSTTPYRSPYADGAMSCTSSDDESDTLSAMSAAAAQGKKARRHNSTYGRGFMSVKIRDSSVAQVNKKRMSWWRKHLTYLTLVGVEEQASYEAHFVKFLVKKGRYSVLQLAMACHGPH